MRLKLGTFGSNDANGNENVKKKKTFYKQNNNFALASSFFVHFFARFFRYVQRVARRRKGCSLSGRRRKGRGRRGVRKAPTPLPLSLPPYPFRHLLCRPTGRTNLKTCPVPLPYLFICDASLVLSESLEQNMISMEKIIPIETSLPLCQSLLTVSSAN